MKRLVRPVQKVNAAVVGLDVHQKMIAFTWLDARGEEVREGRIRATKAEVLALLAGIEGPVHVTIEAGGSTFWLYDLLVPEVGERFVHVAQPKKIKAIANSTQKNDRNDAWWLAYLTYEGRLPECYVPTGRLRELRIAVRERFALVQQATQQRVRIRSHLRQMGIELPTRKLTAARSRDVLVELAQQREDVQAMAVGLLLTHLEQLLSMIAAWEAKIAELAEGFPEIERLQAEVPGVGPKLAAVLIAELGPIDRFATAKAIGRFAGLTPTDRSSAGKTRHGAITREGSEHLRWALTQAAMACTRCRSGAGLAVGHWIRAKERRMGCKGKARVAAARKIAESIWRLFRWGECFDPAKPFGGAPKAA